MSNKIEIPLSKTKILLVVVGAIGFVVAGIYFILNPDQFASNGYGGRQMIQILGVVAAVFLGGALIFAMKKLFDNKVGLVIDDEGIVDNSNATSVGLIEWKDIIGVSTYQVASTKFLILETNDPEKYISRGKNAIVRRGMKMNHNLYGSPLTIISNSLKIKHSELEKLLATEFEKRNTSV